MSKDFGQLPSVDSGLANRQRALLEISTLILDLQGKYAISDAQMLYILNEIEHGMLREVVLREWKETN